ncbi:MAG: FG-GAP-like repeat-containing protein [Planctomycetota bacterium]
MFRSPFLAAPGRSPRYPAFRIAFIFLFCIVGCGKQPPPESSTSYRRRRATLESTAQAIREKRWADADAMLRELTIAAPDDLQIGVLRVESLQSQGRVQDAIDELLRLADLHLDQEHLLRAQAAEILFDNQQYVSAISLLRRVTKDQPHRHAIRSRLAEMLNARGFRHEANNELRYLAGRIPLTFRELVALINPMSTWVTFEERPNITDTQLVERSGVLNVVAALRSRGEVRDALAVLEQSQEFKQSLPPAVAMYGWLLAMSQDEAELKSWVESAPVESRDYPAYWLAVGNLMLRDDPSTSVVCYLAAIRMEPHCTEAVDGLAQALQKQALSKEYRRVRQRRVDLAEVQSLGRKIVNNRATDPAFGIEMGRLLNELGRPIESLAWQESTIARVASRAPQLAILAEHKVKVLRRRPSCQVESRVLIELESPPIDRVFAKLGEVTQQSSVNSVAKSIQTNQPDTLPTPSQPTFVNVAEQVGLRFHYQNGPSSIKKAFRLFESLGSGVACLDFDLDGNTDLYLGQAGGDPPLQPSEHSNRIFRLASKRFIDVTEESFLPSFEYTLGVTSGDWNQDGFPDIVVGNLGVNELWINQGDGTFLPFEPTKEWSNGAFTTSIGIADLDRDSLPEIIEINYVDDDRVFRPIEYDTSGKPILLPGPKQFRPGLDRVFHAVGDGTARVETLGQASDASTGLGLMIADFDHDARNELFIANDQNPNQLWEAEDPWTDFAPALGLAYGTGGRPMACMGIAAADFDGNGWLDLHVTNFLDESSNLFLQTPSQTFVDRALAYQLDRSTLAMVGFGTQAFDYDNNSTADLVVGNGHIEDFRDQGKPFSMPTQILSRATRGFRVADVRGDSAYWDAEHLARGVATVDWNRDGRVDLVVTDLAEPIALLENRTEDVGNWMQLRLVGVKTERDAIGSRVTIAHDSASTVTQVRTGDGYLCKNENILFIGLGDSHSATVEVFWPSGVLQRFNNLRANQRWLLIESESAPLLD